MLNEIINEMESHVGEDDFEYIMELCMEKLEEINAGLEAVTPLLQLMERHPLDDFGMPGAIVHFVERFYGNGYEALLMESVERKPTMHTVWMLNRIKNGSQDKEQYIELMQNVMSRSDVEQVIKDSVVKFL